MGKHGMTETPQETDQERDAGQAVGGKEAAGQRAECRVSSCPGQAHDWPRSHSVDQGGQERQANPQQKDDSLFSLAWACWQPPWFGWSAASRGKCTWKVTCSFYGQEPLGFLYTQEDWQRMIGSLDWCSLCHKGGPEQRSMCGHTFHGCDSQMQSVFGQANFAAATCKNRLLTAVRSNGNGGLMCRVGGRLEGGLPCGAAPGSKMACKSLRVLDHEPNMTEISQANLYDFPAT